MATNHISSFEPLQHYKTKQICNGVIRGDQSSSLGAALGNALLFGINHLFQPHVDINEI